MAKVDVEAVFGELEKVFSGNVIFDEALMNMQLHTAQVRKQWPHLFSVLSQATELINEFGPGIARPPAGSVGREDIAIRVRSQKSIEPIAPIELYSYSNWSTNEAQRSREGEEWNVVWDVAGAPMPTVSSSLTLRTPTHKARFSVQSYLDEMTMVLKMVGALPLTH